MEKKLTDTEILTAELALSELVALPLTDMWRFFSAQRFEFGEQLPAKNRNGEAITRADFTLVAYGWQIEAPEDFKLSSDQFRPERKDEHALPFYGSLKDDPPIVEALFVLVGGGLRIEMSKGYVLTVWSIMKEPPADDDFGDREVWRFIPPDHEWRGHLVMGREGLAWSNGR